MIEYGREEIDYIAGRDPVMRELTKEFGHLERGMPGDVFAALAESIVGQMLSNKAAETIVGRLKAVVGELTLENVLSKSEEELRGAGISRRKAAYILALAQETAEKRLDFSVLAEQSDEEAIAFLMQIKGVGRWTAEMIAEFCLGRKNIFSFDDIALRNGIMTAHGYKTLSRLRFERLKRKYSPYASVASLYYYECNDRRRRGKEV